MANTYSSWEYSQGPTLYIDSSGFESIDDNKNFVYFYVVTYGPVEYRRKVTDDKGVSTYEYKYSFGSSNSDRKTLSRYTFAGKNQVTKTVTHSVTEDGFTKSITKTFVIDTNIATNVPDTPITSIGSSDKFSTSSWKYYNGGSASSLGWTTSTSTGYRTETYYEYVQVERYGVVDWEWYHALVSTGYDYTQFPIYGWYTETELVPRTRTVSYTTTVYDYAYCQLSFKDIRNKIGKYENNSSVIFSVKTKNAISCPPKISIGGSTASAGLRTTLQCKKSGSISAGSVIEYYIPISLLTSTFKNNDTVYIFTEKGSSSTANCYLTEAYAFLEIEGISVPYINLVVQAYNASKESWYDVCTIPYLDYEEIESLRNNQQDISKNLFLPKDLPKTDSSYRIKLDTNLVAKEAERLVGFRMDVLFNQKVAPKSIQDKKLYVKNETNNLVKEIEMGKIDDIKLNALGYSSYEKSTNLGFLKQGANDLHAYMRTSPIVRVEEGVDSFIGDDKTWYNNITSKNGNWLSDTLFVANSHSFTQKGVLKANNLENDIITFKIPYKELKSNSSYSLMFDAYVEEAFTITDVLTINSSDENNVVNSKIYSNSSYDKSKVTIKDINTVFYKPYYKLKTSSGTQLISEYNICKQDVSLKIDINTKTINQNDSNYLTITIKRSAIKNVFFRDMKCICVDSQNKKHVDLIGPPQGEDMSNERLYETMMTIYYDGFNVKHINPLVYKDMIYLKQELDRIRSQFKLSAYPWSDWANVSTSKDKNGHMLGVNPGQPLRATHFNDVKKCCVDTYEKLLLLDPPISLNVSPNKLRTDIQLIPLKDSKPSDGYVLQHYKDKNGNTMTIDEFFPEWRKIIDLLNRN